MEEDLEPFHNRSEIVFPALIQWSQLWPSAVLAILPGVMSQVRDLARPKSESCDVVEIEILKREWSYRRFAALQFGSLGVGPGTSSGEIWVARMERSAPFTPSPNCPDSATHRMR